MVKLYRWTDESWTSVTLGAGYSSNTGKSATPYVLIPCSPGKYSVYIECEGFQAVKAVGGNYPGKWLGVIGYDPNGDGWMAREYSGCRITNYRGSNTFVQGHPDVVLNDCHFNDGQSVECDTILSFHLECDTDGYWALQAPPIQKDDHFNYVVSYAGWTVKDLEWGGVSIAIDEMNGASSSITGRKTHLLTSRAVPTRLEPAPVPASSEVGAVKANTVLPVASRVETLPIVSPASVVDRPDSSTSDTSQRFGSSRDAPLPPPVPGRFYETLPQTRSGFRLAKRTKGTDK